VTKPAQESTEMPVAERKLVNAGELCRALGRSRPWLDQRLVEDPNFPVVARGGRGAQWQFDLAEAMAYVEAQDTLRALVAVLTPQSRLAEAKAKMAEMEIAERMGRLIDAEEMQQVLGSAFAALGSAIDSTLDQLARRHGWSEAVRFDAGDAFDAARRAFVASASRIPEAEPLDTPEAQCNPA